VCYKLWKLKSIYDLEKAYSTMWNEESSRNYVTVRRLKVYPVLYVIILLPGLVDRVYDICTLKRKFILVAIDLAVYNLMGFFNFLCQGCTGVVLHEW
jgi:hypothetical protein